LKLFRGWVYFEKKIDIFYLNLSVANEKKKRLMWDEKRKDECGAYYRDMRGNIGQVILAVYHVTSEDGYSMN
jgi:hypothetical protein